MKEKEIERGAPAEREKSMASKFAAGLLRWREKNSPRFPWRRTASLYKALLAEALLRKTTRSRATELFESAVECYPGIKELARADAEELERLIEPLGMQKKRARLLIKLAQAVLEAHGGRIPRNRDELVKLPGVGRYTANAVLCIACGKQLALVDTNAVRLIKRVFRIKSSRARARTAPGFWRLAESLIPKGRAKDFNLAVLDFGSSVCTAKSPKCAQRPLRDMCAHFAGKKSTAKV